MTTIEEHREIVREFLDDINEKIRANLVLDRQKIIGFAASEASVNLFAILLHSKNLIEPTFSINHRFFASQRIAERKFNIDFSNKNKILKLLVNQESYRNKLSYGKKKDLEIVNNSIKNLYEIKEIIDKETEVKK